MKIPKSKKILLLPFLHFSLSSFSFSLFSLVTLFSFFLFSFLPSFFQGVRCARESSSMRYSTGTESTIHDPRSISLSFIFPIISCLLPFVLLYYIISYFSTFPFSSAGFFYFFLLHPYHYLFRHDNNTYIHILLFIIFAFYVFSVCCLFILFPFSLLTPSVHIDVRY